MGFCLHRICAATISLIAINNTWPSYTSFVSIERCTCWTTTTPTTHRAFAALRAPALCPRRLLPLCGRLVRRPAALKWVWVHNQPSLAPAAVPSTTTCQLPACNLSALNFKLASTQLPCSTALVVTTQRLAGSLSTVHCLPLVCTWSSPEPEPRLCCVCFLYTLAVRSLATNSSSVMNKMATLCAFDYRAPRPQY